MNERQRLEKRVQTKQTPRHAGQLNKPMVENADRISLSKQQMAVQRQHSQRQRRLNNDFIINLAMNLARI